MGFVFEFCPVCRCGTKHTIINSYLVSHIYYIPTWRKKYNYSEKTCLTCNTGSLIEQYSFERTIKKNKHIQSLDMLKKETFPDFDEVYNKRLKIEKEMKIKILSQDEKRFFIDEIFQYLSFDVEKKLKSTPLDLTILFGFFGSFIVSLSIGFVISYVLALKQSESEGMYAVLVLMAIAYIIYLFIST